MKDKILNLYLSYVNDFLTVERFAEYYGINVIEANLIIDKGREINNNLANERLN